MKKERFKEIVSSCASTADEIKSLKKLADEYPFSQIIHLLLANSSKKNNLEEFKPSLMNAAFHSTDRSILKSLIENNLIPPPSIKSVKSSPALASKTKQEGASESVIKEIIPKSSVIDSDKLIADVLKNLAKLQKIKKETALWLDKKPELKTVKKKTVSKKITPKSKPKKNLSKPKAQTKIIEKFIKEEPRITKNSSPMNDKQDMSKESTKMREDVISESLAKIFVKQGKNGKAIDIYKKLIWKFPQKKSLFAAQIEKLKKK